jgi:HK97 family phage major capsid protein
MTVTYKEKLMKANALYKEAQAILSNEDAKPEEKERVDTLIQQADGLKEEAKKLKSIEEMIEESDLFEDESGPADQAKGRSPKKKKDFEDFGDFVKEVRVAYRSKGRTVDPRLETFVDITEPEAKDLSGASGADGGFLIPVQQLNEIMAVAAPMTVVRQRATVIRMASRYMRMPVLDQTGTSQSNPAFFGGIEVFWQEEASEKTASDPQWRQMTMEAFKLIAYTRIGDELLEDADGVADFLSSNLGFPGAIAWKEDYAFLRGSGVGQPLGVINAPGTVTVARATASAIGYVDLVNMMAAFMGQAPVWVATHNAKASLMTMEGPSGNPSYLWGNATQGMPQTLLGYPIEFVDKLPGVGTQGDIMLCDFRYYLIGDRKRTTVEFSREERFKYDQTTFRGVHRVGGQPWLSAPITITDGDSTQLSPFVVLGAASS